MDSLINYLNKGDYYSLIILLSIFILTWLYKTIFSNLQTKKKSDLDFIDNSIKAHSRCLLEIHKKTDLGSNNLSEIYESLYGLFEYTDDTIIKEINSYINGTDSATLLSISKLINEKVISLRKKQQHSSITKNYEPFFLDALFDYFNKINLDILLQPILYILGLIYASLSIYNIFIYPFTYLNTSKYGTIGYLNYVLFILGSLIAANAIVLSVNNIINKRENNKNKFIHIVTIMLMPIIFLLLYIIKIFTIKIIIVIAFLVLSMIFTYKNLKIYSLNH